MASEPYHGELAIREGLWCLGIMPSNCKWLGPCASSQELALFSQSAGEMRLPAASGSWLERIKVLVVDSDVPSVRLIQATLSDERWAVQGAGTAAEAIHVAAAFQPDVILLELVLPDMRGLDLVRLLKSDSSTAEAAIVVVTASNEPRSERLALEAGSRECLRKPIDVLSLPVRLLSFAGKNLEPNGATSKDAQ